MIIDNPNLSDTICAPATGNGGAIAIVRISGKDSLNIAAKIFKSKSGKPLNDSESHRIYFGEIVDGETIIDEVLASVFRDDKSYTGEPSVEFSLHDSPYIIQQVLNLLAKHGARPAAAGEFSMRAYLNGKIDLAQAEAVADLIGSRSASAHKVAMRHLKGDYSIKIKRLRDEFINFASLLELELDFAEEDVEFADRTKFIQLIEKLETEIQRLADSYRLGKVLKTGIPVAIVGKPNVGKSTILNLLLEDDKAIISDVPGTTRDVIEDTITINGYLFRFIDTAGIRHSDDVVEKLGIERTMAKIDEAMIILYITDHHGFSNDDLKRINKMELSEKKVFRIINKVDLLNDNNETKDETIRISALKDKTILPITNVLTEYVNKFNIEDQSIVTSARHAEALNRTLIDLENIKQGFTDGIPTDLIAIDVRNAMKNLREITGEITTDNLLGNIFSKFCIGK